MSNNKKNKFYGVNDDLWGHKWGFKDSSFIINDDNTVTFTGKRYEGISGERLPYLIPFVTKVLNTDIKKEPYFKEIEKKYVTERKINQDFVNDIKSFLSDDQLVLVMRKEYYTAMGKTLQMKFLRFCMISLKNSQILLFT